VQNQEQTSLVSSCWRSGSLPGSPPFLKSMNALFELTTYITLIPGPTRSQPSIQWGEAKAGR